MIDAVPIRRALISVSDKTGVVEFARALAARGVTIISTGGTARLLGDSGISVVPIDHVTGFPEIMDGRVKTLHPKVHGGILAVRGDAEHIAAMKRHGIEAIDLVCVNLYPFEQTIAKPGATRDEAIENIDVGGPAMIRAAAKNHEYVCVVTDPTQYGRVHEELAAHGGTTHALRSEFAAAAFARTGAYDRAIAAYLSGAKPGTAEKTPDVLDISFPLGQRLRYGENPHQSAALYRDPNHAGPSIVGAEQLHGKELSYNNINDGAAALALALDLKSTLSAADSMGTFAAAIIKHANPCGAAIASTPADAIEMAFRGDPLAAYGGILACAAPIDASAASVIARPNQFLEVVIAESFDDAALAILRDRSANIRLLATGPHDRTGRESWMFKSIPGGALAQSIDALPADTARWQHRAGPAPTAAQLAASAAIWTICKHLSSNAIAIGGQEPECKTGVRLFGAGAGQMDRVTSCRLAAEKSGVLAQGAIAASDAFFPFADGPQILIDAGIALIIHSGGSKRDQETFDLCERRAVTCLTTGVRHFRH